MSSGTTCRVLSMSSGTTSCAIVRGNASVYGDVAARIVQAGGHAFVPGSDVVLAD